MLNTAELSALEALAMVAVVLGFIGLLYAGVYYGLRRANQVRHTMHLRRQGDDQMRHALAAYIDECGHEIMLTASLEPFDKGYRVERAHAAKLNYVSQAIWDKAATVIVIVDRGYTMNPTQAYTPED